MSHFKEYKGDVVAADGRNLGDEWTDWDGKENGTIREGKTLFLICSSIVLVFINILVCFFVYLVSPRLASWVPWLPAFVWGTAIFFVIITSLWFVILLITIISGKKIFPIEKFLYLPVELTFSRVFHVSRLFGISRDRVGHSFVQVSNTLSYALKPKDRKEKLLILLPRCLSKEQLKNINDLKNMYPIDIHTVSGGELARKKVKELKPTAVIGVACERDLVSGIRDVGQKLSVIGIPNERPEGPCKNTIINMDELIRAIEFYIGKPAAARHN